jgi:hypothetical protein
MKIKSKSQREEEEFYNRPSCYPNYVSGFVCENCSYQTDCRKKKYSKGGTDE